MYRRVLYVDYTLTPKAAPPLSALGLGETTLCSFVSFIYMTIFLFYVKNMLPKKIGIEESVLLFWESVLLGHFRDSFVLTKSFANRP